MDFLKDLNPPQKEAVLHPGGPMIIFAGAGTGKTRVITYRIAHLLKNGVSPYSILAVTFTNKAADQMRQRVDALVPGLGRSVLISTFHSFGARFLRQEALAIGINPDFVIYDSSDQKKLVQICIEELKLDEKRFKPSRVTEYISRAKDDLLDAESFAATALTSNEPNRQAVASIYSLYQKKLTNAGALDFGDLLMISVLALGVNEALRQKYQNRFEHILVDEYQDTNHAQYLLTKYLSAKHKNICVVGDDDQSIYSWRGANIRNILDFENDNPSCKVIKLEQNYRSTPNIIESAWNVIKNNSDRVEKHLWTQNSSGSSIEFISSYNEIAEAENIVNAISNYVINQGRAYGDFAIFYRTNAQSRVLEDALRRNGIAYKIIGSVKFYERAEVKDALAYLRLVHNTADSLALKRIINIPRRGIGKTSLESLEALAGQNGTTLWQAVSNCQDIYLTPSTRKALNSFTTLINSLRAEKNNMPVKQLTELVFEKTKYPQMLEEEDTLEAKAKIENLNELLSAMDEFQQRSEDKTLSGYLTQVSLVSGSDELDDNSQKVTLMTLHLAKGLEFPFVFVTGLEEGLFPIGEAAFDKEQLEEERRLMYVGMTRAKEKLHLSWAAQRRLAGKTNWAMQSRFVEEAYGRQNHIKHTQKKTNEQKISIINVHNFEAPQSAPSPFPLGVRVHHSVFGDGKVIEKSGSGDDLKLVILFDSGGWKKIYPKFAKLDRI